jgi:hypothetical protein
MLSELHHVLRELIYDRGLIDRAEVDIAFEVPTTPFVEGLIKPTVCLYLFEMQENLELRQAQLQTRRTNGHAEFRAPPRRIDLHYVISALTTDSDDSVKLLWRTFGVLMRAPELGPELFPDDFFLDAPVVTRIAEPDNGIKVLDVWSAVGSEPRPAFSYIVTVPVDLALEFKTPLVLTRSIAFKRLHGESVPETRTFITGVVRDAIGAAQSDVTVALATEPRAWTRTDTGGHYVLATPNEGRVSLLLSRPGETPRSVVVEVPSESYDLEL